MTHLRDIKKTKIFSKLGIFADRILFKLERQSAQRDSLKWRQSHPVRATDPDISVQFFIPIFEKIRAPDWVTVTVNLNRTIRALQRQSDPRWRAIICTQDIPQNLITDHRIQFLHYPYTHNGGSDKNHKMRYIARTLAQTTRQDSYAFFLDGDDIPHPDLVEYILNDNNGYGYYLPQGYSLDLSTQQLYQHSDTPEIDYPFTTVCGSSHAVRFDTRVDKSHTLHVSLRGNHREIRQNLKSRLHLELQPVPFAAMLYLFSHGSSDQDLISSAKGASRRAVGKPVASLGETERVFETFGVIIENCQAKGVT